MGHGRAWWPCPLCSREPVEATYMETGRKELPMALARSMCWHCQSDIGGEYFCGQCVKVQPLSKDIDYFTCLGLPRKLNIDTGSLETKFYELSRAFHPDFYEGKSE